MKKKFTALLTAALCVTAMVSAISANAVETTVTDDYVYTITTDTFTYTSKLHTIESDAADPDFMVTGIVHGENGKNSYYVTPLNGLFLGDGTGVLHCDSWLDGYDVQVGDMLKAEGELSCAEVFPPCYHVYSADGETLGKFVDLGNGVDLYGEDFAEVIRMVCAIEQADYIRCDIDRTDIDWGTASINWDNATMEEMQEFLTSIALEQKYLGRYDMDAYFAKLDELNQKPMGTTLNKDGSYTITAENFTYTSSPFQIESEIADPDFLVVGIIYSESDPSKISSYFIDPIVKPGCHSQGYGKIWSSTVKQALGDIELHIGDLLKFDGGYDVLEVEPAIYAPYDDTKQTYLGNGVDVFGEEFADVIRMQVSFHQADFLKMALSTENIDWGGITVNWGDVNMDDELDILDCISVNKYLLGSSNFCFYTKEIADVNMDGKLDSTDSLCILKEVVGLTVNYEPAVD